MASNNEYVIERIENEADARLCAKLLAEEFAAHNPLAVYNQLTEQELFDAWLWPVTKDIFDQKLSFLVRHHPTNEIIATSTASDLFLRCKKHPYDATAPASDNPVMDLFGEMLNQFVQHDFGQELKPNMVLSISSGATRSQHAGKGLAAQLRAHVCNHARDAKGYEYAFVQTAHPATSHIYMNKMNGKEMSSVDAATWLWKKKGDGLSRPLKDFKGEPILNVLVKLK